MAAAAAQPARPSSRKFLRCARPMSASTIAETIFIAAIRSGRLAVPISQPLATPPLLFAARRQQDSSTPFATAWAASAEIGAWRRHLVAKVKVKTKK